MKKIFSIVSMLAMLTVSAVVFEATAHAEEVKMVGSITKIEMAADSTSAAVTLKDSKTGENVVVQISDEMTLDKLKSKRIVDGDEIRSKYDNQDGKNVARIFKKTAGC